jgi:hypothetical protein
MTRRRLHARPQCRAPENDLTPASRNEAPHHDAANPGRRWRLVVRAVIVAARPTGLFVGRRGVSRCATSFDATTARTATWPAMSCGKTSDARIASRFLPATALTERSSVGCIASDCRVRIPFQPTSSIRNTLGAVTSRGSPTPSSSRLLVTREPTGRVPSAQSARKLLNSGGRNEERTPGATNEWPQPIGAALVRGAKGDILDINAYRGRHDGFAQAAVFANGPQ